MVEAGRECSRFYARGGYGSARLAYRGGRAVYTRFALPVSDAQAEAFTRQAGAADVDPTRTYLFRWNGTAHEFVVGVVPADLIEWAPQPGEEPMFEVYAPAGRPPYREVPAPGRSPDRGALADPEFNELF